MIVPCSAQKKDFCFDDVRDASLKEMIAIDITKLVEAEAKEIIDENKKAEFLQFFILLKEMSSENPIMVKIANDGIEETSGKGRLPVLRKIAKPLANISGQVIAGLLTSYTANILHLN